MRRLSIVMGVLALLLLTGGPALAEPPFDVPSQITDSADVLDSAGEARIQDALDQLQSDENLQLFVVYVPSFDGLDPSDWALATASGPYLSLIHI